MNKSELIKHIADKSEIFQGIILNVETSSIRVDGLDKTHLT